MKKENKHTATIVHFKLPHGATPIKATGYRNLDCPYYKECLNYVSGLFLDNFTCANCQHIRDESGRDNVILIKEEGSHPWPIVRERWRR